ncbi:chloride channel B [Actinidia rufa]|uniref:Chloride channel B n=1 Tax=Actinidia rufa TaxID=165716 RepID=A0A7J0DAC8_9ERIC|nr:chloride channel B [Actinidia rufa]
MEAQANEERDPECNSLHQLLLKRNRPLSSTTLAMVGTKVSIHELRMINENDIFKHEWRSRSTVQVLQYIFLKWTVAFLIGLLTGIIAILSNLAVENIAGYLMGFIFLAGVNFFLTLIAAVVCVCFAPTAAGQGIPEIKAYLNGGGLDNYRIKWRWLRYFNNDRDHRDIITCGASGVCAAFRAPVGGVLFALEEGGLIMFDESGVTVSYHVMDSIPVAVIGVIGGVLGSLYNYLLHKVLRLYNLKNELFTFGMAVPSGLFLPIILMDLKGLPFLEANPEPRMRNITVGELADVKAPVVTLNGVEKVGRIVDVLTNTTHNGFPLVDEGVIPPVGFAIGATKLQGIVLTSESSSCFSTQEEVRDGKIEEVAVTKDEMEMYIDLHSLTNRTPYTVMESMSVAKALVLFKQVGLRHMLIVPQYQAAGVSPVMEILTRSHSSKVARDDLCFPKKGDSPWVQWSYKCIIKNKCIWAVSESSDCSSTWRKLLKHRLVASPMEKHITGDDPNTFLWFDNWHPLGPLTDAYRPRIVHNSGSNLNAKVSSIIKDGTWVRAARTERSHQMPLAWHKLVWSPKCIAKHSFILWLAIKGLVEGLQSY